VKTIAKIDFRDPQLLLRLLFKWTSAKVDAIG